jgi:glycolate oxidase FAD binding subunit
LTCVELKRKIGMDEFIKATIDRIKQSAANKTPLAIRGGNTKAFYGAATLGEALDVRPYSGIIDYEPKELVLTVRAGTPLSEIEAIMEKSGQMLPFEPPYFAPGATIGGTVASGLSGPRRPYTGAVRDFVLGARIINGKGEDLNFGGRVIKNVAGYDVSRLMTGAMGTLGVLLDLSFKVLPKPPAEVTLRCFMLDEASAIKRMNEWAGKPLPLSATSWYEGTLLVRLSGAVAGVKAAREKMGGDLVDADENSLGHPANGGIWGGVRDHATSFFKTDKPLWRLSVPSTTPPLNLDMPQFIEWGGALRWVAGDTDVVALRKKVEAIGGHVTLFRGGDKSQGVFHPLQPTLVPIHRNLKAAFDPENILNRGRMDNF